MQQRSVCGEAGSPESSSQNKQTQEWYKEERIDINDKHFREPKHSFKDFRMIIIEEIADTTMNKEQIRYAVKERRFLDHNARNAGTPWV